MLIVMPSLLGGFNFIGGSEDGSKRRYQQPENRYNSPKGVEIWFLISLLMITLWWWFEGKIALTAWINRREAPVADINAQETSC